MLISFTRRSPFFQDQPPARIAVNPHKQHAFFNLLTNRYIPRIAAAQLRLIEPDLTARRTQDIANTPRRVSILRCVRKKNGFDRR